MGFDDSLNFLEKSFMGSSNSYDDSELSWLALRWIYERYRRFKFGPENQECFQCNRIIAFILAHH